MITSRSNETIQSLKSLLTKKGRQEHGRLLLEGEKLIEDALRSGLVPDIAVVSKSYDGRLLPKLQGAGCAVLLCSDEVLLSISDTRTPQGIVARCNLPAPADANRRGLWVGLDCLQDPGNLGSIIRSADAMGASGVLLGRGCADAFSPKAVRSAMGSVFHLPLVCAELLAEAAHMRRHGFYVIASCLDGCTQPPPARADTLLLIGNESRGLSQELLAISDYRFTINMRGAAESLNAAAACAIALYALSSGFPPPSA